MIVYPMYMAILFGCHGSKFAVYPEVFSWSSDFALYLKE